MKHIIATAHGTDNAEGQATINLIREELAALLHEKAPGAYTVHEAYVDVQTPDLKDVVAGFGADDEVVIVPLLLSTGYHTQVDLVKAAEASAATVKVARALGPSAALARLQRQRLEEAGWDGYGDLVMAAAGSSREEGRAAVQMQSEIFSTLISQWTPHGFVADIDPKIADVADEVQADYISSYLLGHGFFQAKLAQLDIVANGAVLANPLVVPGDEAAARVVAEVAIERLEEV